MIPGRHGHPSRMNAYTYNAKDDALVAWNRGRHGPCPEGLDATTDTDMLKPPAEAHHHGVGDGNAGKQTKAP